MVKGGSEGGNFAAPWAFAGFTIHKETPMDPHVDLLPYPLKDLHLGDVVIEEYVIPDEARALVLSQLFIFTPVPKLWQWKRDIHTDRVFQVKEYRVLRFNERNWLYGPFVEDEGGSIIDWIPAAPPRRQKKEERGASGA